MRFEIAIDQNMHVFACGTTLPVEAKARASATYRIETDETLGVVTVQPTKNNVAHLEYSSTWVVDGSKAVAKETA